MPKKTNVAANLPLIIRGRYFFDMREGWNIFQVREPVDYVKEECFMCEGSGKSVIYKDGKCGECNGRGHTIKKIYPFRPDELADFISSLNIRSGEDIKITITSEHRPKEAVYLWNGQVTKGKDLLGTQMES